MPQPVFPGCFHLCLSRRRFAPCRHTTGLPHAIDTTCTLSRRRPDPPHADRGVSRSGAYVITRNTPGNMGWANAYARLADPGYKVVNQSPREKKDRNRNPHRKTTAKQLKTREFFLGFTLGFSFGFRESRCCMRALCFPCHGPHKLSQSRGASKLSVSLSLKTSPSVPMDWRG
jgi:hypothetical protein